MSLHGFIANAPELNVTDKGHARFYARVGVEQFRKEVDGSFTKLDKAFRDLVMSDRSAEGAYVRLEIGDQFVASGTTARGPATRSTGRRHSSPTCPATRCRL